MNETAGAELAAAQRLRRLSDSLALSCIGKVPQKFQMSALNQFKSAHVKQPQTSGFGFSCIEADKTEIGISAFFVDTPLTPTVALKKKSHRVQ